MTDNPHDEIIDVRLPRAEYDRLRVILERERTYNWITNRIHSTWIWVLGGGVVIFLTLYDRITEVVK